MPPKVRRRPRQEGEEGEHEEDTANGNRQTDGRLIRARNWVYTLWSATEPVRPTVDSRDQQHVTFNTYQRELAPNPSTTNPTGGLHWQGYLELDDRFSEPQVRLAMGWDVSTRVFLRPRAGSQLDAINYVKKKDTAVADTHREEGTRAPPDAPGGWSNVIEDVRAGASFDDICANHTRHAIQYGNGLRTVMQTLHPPTAFREVQVFYRWGPTGTGKTHAVYDEHPISTIYKKLSGQWWDGLSSSHRVLLLDDFYGVNYGIDYDTFLQVADRYPYTCNVRGSTVGAGWTVIVITSNQTINELWKFDKSGKERDRTAMARRIPDDHIIYTGTDPIEEEKGKWQIPENIERRRKARAAAAEKEGEGTVKVQPVPEGLAMPARMSEEQMLAMQAMLRSMYDGMQERPTQD